MSTGRPTPRELALRFNELIRPTLTGQPRDTPVVLFIGGQPGAGKTTVQSAVLGRMGRKQAFPLDGDDLVALHPNYRQLQRANDMAAAYRASEDVGSWWPRAARLLRMQRLDVAVSAPLAGWEWANARFADFKRAGYRTEVAFVPTPEARSLQGIADRYQQARRPEVDRWGRWVLPEGHDIAYRGVLDTVDRIDAAVAVDAVHVVRRDGVIIHSNESVDGRWALGVATRQVIEGERSRVWTEAESGDFLHKQGSLRERTSPEWVPLLDEIDRRALNGISPVAVLDDVQLNEQAVLVTRAHAAAVEAQERSQERSKELGERSRGGGNEVRLQDLRARGASEQQLDYARLRLDQTRWAAGLTAWSAGLDVGELASLDERLTSERARRVGLRPEDRAAEQAGREGHRVLRRAAGLREDLVLPEHQPVVIRRASTTDPGPARWDAAPASGPAGSGATPRAERSSAAGVAGVAGSSVPSLPPSRSRGSASAGAER
ncbi:zeta toxin family protein [Kitasatospora xanthocidica]|uniref:zeta toxin family protein n=1 Tax=Kitasatospora xanthocidica TaxID=83382 RepID=UPI0036E0B0C9